jgi:hypothetical protein
MLGFSCGGDPNRGVLGGTLTLGDMLAGADRLRAESDFFADCARQAQDLGQQFANLQQDIEGAEAECCPNALDNLLGVRPGQGSCPPGALRRGGRCVEPPLIFP